MRITHTYNLEKLITMESVYLKSFIEAVNAGSFSKAAETLCVTQSAVSRRIKFLEDQYGYPLLDRSGPVLQTTAAGCLVLEKAKKLLEIEKELLCGLEEMTMKPRVSFCCTPAFGIAYLPGILKDFMLQNIDMSDLKFMFDMPDNVVKGLKDKLFDLAVIEHCSCLDLSGFNVFSLPEDEMIFVSSPLLGINSPVSAIETLLTHNLYSRKEGCCSKTFLDFNMKKLDRKTSEFSKIIVYDDLHLIIQTVIDGQGIAFISRSVAEKYLMDGQLLAHRVNGFEHNRKRTFILNDATKPDVALFKFIKCIFSSFNLTAPEFS